MTIQPTHSVTPAGITPIIIASDNSFAHAYGSVSEMLTEKDVGAKGQGALEFFDRKGRRLAPVFNQMWELEGLAPTLDEPDPELVQGRLQAVVQHVADYIRRHPELAEESGLTLEQALDGLPELDGSSLAADAAQFPGSENPSGSMLMSRGSFFHNALHAAGINH